MFTNSHAIHSLRNFKGIYNMYENNLETMEWLGDPTYKPTDAEIIAEVDRLNQGGKMYENCPPECLIP